jgi:hypothetical protein
VSERGVAKMNPLSLAGVALAVGALAACSTGKPPGSDEFPTGSGSVGGTGGGAGASGASATGGAGPASGGTDGSGATGGDASTGGTGGAGMAGSGTSGGAGGDAATGGASGAAGSGVAGSAAESGSAGMATAGTAGMDPGICQKLSVISTPQIPTVELLVDTSSSMWDLTPPPWPLLYDALMNETTGVVKPLQSKVRFGFASFKGHEGTSETDPACATMTTVDPALDNLAAIKTTYDEIATTFVPDSWPKWETPTNFAINYATKVLTDFMPDPPGKKYILLVTDGNPNTCEVINPQCGQDLAIKAAQDAFAAGIGLFVLGFGAIVSDPTNGCPSAARCGLLHLQDLANAGVGAPVHPAPTCDDPTASSCIFKNEACNKGGVLQAAYTPDAPDVGAAFAVDTTASNPTAELVDALTAILNDAISCTVDMDAIVTGDASLGNVKLGGTALTYNDPNGWTLESNAYSVTLVGTACTTFKAGSQLDIDFPCDPSGNPIAVHR